MHHYSYAELLHNKKIKEKKGKKGIALKGLSHEIDFKNFDKNLQNLT